MQSMATSLPRTLLRLRRARPTYTLRTKVYTCDSPETASVIFTAMGVEKELRENLVTRDMVLEGATLTATFKAVDEQSLNASVSAFGKSFDFAQEIRKELG